MPDGWRHDRPFATITKVKGALRLATLNHAARGAGLGHGQTLADARAMVPDLVVDNADDAADIAWLDRLAAQCQDYTPSVTPHPPDALALDITGCAHLFGGEAAMLDALCQHMHGCGMTVAMGMASTAAGALALARHGGGPTDGDTEAEGAAIRALPVAALGLDRDASVALHRAGLKTVGALAGRPMATIAARFGPAAVDALRRLLGDAAEAPSPRPFATPVTAGRRFAEPMAHLDGIMPVIAQLFDSCGAALAARHLGGRRFVITLSRSDGAQRTLVIDTGRATRETPLLMRLVRERIGALADPIDPGFGFDAVHMRVARTQMLAPWQDALSHGVAGRQQSSESEDVAALIDRLSTRLGPRRIHRMIARDSHIPEQAQQIVPAMLREAVTSWPVPDVDEPPARPLLLFDPPQRIMVMAEVPDGPPLHFRWRDALHKVVRHEGPERIAAEWWRHDAGGDRSKGRLLTRDYYRVEDEAGNRFWLFRHGLYDERPDPIWYVHGLFA